MTSRSRGAIRPSLVRVTLEKRRVPCDPQEGRRECRGARCTRGLVRKVREGDAHTSIQVQRRHPAFPARWLYGLCRALLGDEFVLSPSSADSAAARPGRVRTSHRRLGTSNGCQDHTVLPYATTSFVVHARHRSRGSTRPATAMTRRRCRVHHIPSRVRDDARPPLVSEQDDRTEAGDLGSL
jgi:hypothetical protein